MEPDGLAWNSGRSRLLRILFVIYCLETGLFLVIVPWRELWDFLIARSVLGRLGWGALFLTPWARGAITGFGAVHLLWGAHDLEHMFLNRSLRGAGPLAADPDSVS